MNGAGAGITGGLCSVAARPATLGMEKRFRLRKSGDFQLVRREGRSWAHPLLVLYARPNALDQTRFGFVVSKRIGGAVVRNRVRRRLREAVRLRLAMVRPGWDVLFIARSPLATADFAQIGAAMEQLLRRAGLWSGPPDDERASRRASVAPEEAGPPAAGEAESKA